MRPISRVAGPLALLLVFGGGAALATRAPAPSGRGQGGDQPGASLRDEIEAASLGGGRRDVPREFYFTRGIYSGRVRYWDRGSWAIDYPKADRQFVFGLTRLTDIDAFESENPVRLSDSRLSGYPFLYILEVGYMDMTDAEVVGLRRYLKAGGFLFVDDFWGTWEWRNFETQIERVLPGRAIVELPIDHPLFHVFYDIDRVVQVPSVRIINGGPTWEKDGYIPYVRGIFDDDGRLMVLINWNTDLGDAWEWVDNPYYPIQYSDYAYQLAVNAILYSMSH